MVFKSAYQRSFRGPKWDDFTVDEFQRKNQYRADRRSVEHQHQAWLWDSDGEEDVEEIPMPEPSHKKQEVKQVTNTRNEPNDNERRQSIKAWVDEQQGISGEEGKKIEEEKEPRIGDRKVDPSRQLRNRNETDEAKHRHNRTTYPKHRFPQRKLHFNMKERESFGPDDIDEKKKHPPFLPYGWANDAPTEFRKTHNVLASDPEVYPAALRAAKRRQNVIKQKVRLHEEAIKNKQLTPPLNNEKNRLFPEEMWLTEYQRNFCKTDDLKRPFGR